MDIGFILNNKIFLTPTPGPHGGLAQALKIKLNFRKMHMNLPNQENIYKDFKINEGQFCKKSKCANHFISVVQPKSCCYGCTMKKNFYRECVASRFVKFYATR